MGYPWSFPGVQEAGEFRGFDREESLVESAVLLAGNEQIGVLILEEMIEIPKGENIVICEDDPGIAVGVFDERLGELQFGFQRNLSKVGVILQRGTGDEIKLVNPSPRNGIENFGKVTPDNDVPIEEEAEEGGNLGFAKLSGCPESGRIEKNCREEEGERSCRVCHEMID